MGANNSIINQVKALLRGKDVPALDLSASGLKVIVQKIQTVQTVRDAYKDGVYFRSIIIIEFELEEI